jgi:Escherichia/Staphylococcus phage prohead protease
MSVHCEAPLERAMVLDAEAREYPRPASIRATVPRLRAWRVAPESCMVCFAETALCIRSTLALCFRCRESRLQSREDIALLRRRLAGYDEVRAFDERHLSGHAVVYNVLSLDLGGFRELIRPEATIRTLRQGTDLLALWNHESSFPLGRISAGNLRVWSDDKGLMSSLVPPSEARREIEAVELGLVTGGSFAFRSIDDDWHIQGDDVIREMIDMLMSEISAVTFPAYPQTDIALSQGVSGRSIDWLRKMHRTRLA